MEDLIDYCVRVYIWAIGSLLFFVHIYIQTHVAFPYYKNKPVNQ